MRFVLFLTFSLAPFYSALAQDPDADLPGFLNGRTIDKQTYLQLRSANILLRRGIPPGQSPGAAALARTNAIRTQSSAPLAPTLSLSSWTPLGPAPLPNGQVAGGAGNISVSGRVTAIAADPTDVLGNTVYVGTAQGGVFRTLDGGTTWTALMDTVATLVIGAITVDPLDHTIVFVGTGEGNGPCLDCFGGVGLYRINNANTSPVVSGPFETRVAGTGTAATSVHAFLGTSIIRIVVDPADGNRIYVGNTVGRAGIGGAQDPFFAQWGLYFSNNALGATPTFSLVNTGAGGAGNLGNMVVTDIVFEPASSSNLVIAHEDLFTIGGGGIYRTTNATVAPGAAPTFTNTLATAANVNIRLAINKVSATVTVVAATSTSNGTLMRSSDGGVTWATLTNASGIGFCGTQCFYDEPVALDPGNAARIYAGGSFENGATPPHTFLVSTNGTAAAGSVTFTTSSTNLHPDMHDIVPVPLLPSTIYVGNDGGMFKSINSGATWTSLNNAGLNTLQFMSVATHPLDYFFTIGGTQDNGTPWLQPSNAWTRSDSGDGGFARIDQNAANNTAVTMYHTYFNQSPNLIGFARSTVSPPTWPSFLGCQGGVSNNGISCFDRVNFYAPMELGPGNPNTLYFGTNVLYRSTNSGSTMTAASQVLSTTSQISAIGIASSNDSVRAVGLNNGHVFATTTGANPLTDVTPPGNTTYVGRIVIDPTATNTAYVALAGFLAAGANVLKTTNLNAASPTWTSSGAGLPQVPVDSLVIDPNDHTSIFAGTDIGVYHSADSGGSWIVFGAGLPAVACFDLSIENLHRVLRVATHGRGIWEIGLSGAITAVKVSAFSATRNVDSRVLLAWQTGFGADDLGYRIYREENGQKVLITPGMIAGGALMAPPAAKLLAGRSYAWTDTTLARGIGANYWLEVVHLNGGSEWYGPAGVQDSRTRLVLPANAALLTQVGASAKRPSTAQRGALLPGSAGSPQSKANAITAGALQQQAQLAAGSAVKLSVKQEGWYRITQPQLVAAGLDPAIDPRSLQLFVDGSEVPISVRGEADGTFDAADSIEFYGVGLDTAASDSRTYWLVNGKGVGRRLQQTASGRPQGDPAAPLLYSVESRPRTIYFSSLRNGDKENFFGPVITTVPVDQVLTLHNVATDAPGSAQLEVTVQGATAGPHAVKILVNGTDLGAVSFLLQEQGVERLTIPQSLLVEGDNTVRMVALAEGDVSLVDMIRLTYWRRQSVDGDTLRFNADGGQGLTLDSFSSQNIRVLDVTDPDQAQEVTGAIGQTANGYSIAFTVPNSNTRTLFAFVDGNVQQPAAVWANSPSSWRQAGAGADMAIVAHKSLMGSFDQLSQLRQAQGYKVAVVDVEDIFDEFSFGHKSPQAIRDF